MVDELILKRLLHKYENSKHFLEPGASHRRVFLNIERQELPEYHYESADIRDSFNVVAKNLEASGLLRLTWLAGNLQRLNTIELCLDRVDDAYAAVGLENPKRIATELMGFAEQTLKDCSTSWIRAWMKQVADRVASRGKIPNQYSDFGKLQKLLKAMEVYDGLCGVTITMRAFSIRCFGDSKVFEREVCDEFVNCAKKYDDFLAEFFMQESANTREVLSYLGIYARNELYEISGPYALLLPNNVLEFSSIENYSLGISSSMIDSIHGFGMQKVKRIIFIENKTNYDEFLLRERCEGDMVIYHGGILGPYKRKLFKLLGEGITDDIPVYLWADIDLGGFRMFNTLKCLVPQVRPWRMEAKDVERFAAFGLKRTEKYWTKLQSLQNKAEYGIFADTIAALLKYKVTIEQEVFLI